MSGTWGIAPVFVIDSLTFLLSAICIARIRYNTMYLPASTYRIKLLVLPSTNRLMGYVT